MSSVSNLKSSSLIIEMESYHPNPIARAKSMVFVDPASHALLQLLQRIAPSRAPVSIGGETGTGKELIARHIHHLSARKGPFLAVNCGAINESLAESELFGHEAGSFTGASGRREGWFEAANHGTLFLDEIGELPLPLQAKLLRVLQEQEVVRIGSRKSIPVDVRIVSATNVDLGEAVAAGRFRLDLFYRLNVAQVRLPPLRERLDDIAALADHFIRTHCNRSALPAPMLTSAALTALRQYSWPGNIRELENVIQLAVLLAEQEIRPEHLKLDGAVGIAGAISTLSPLQSVSEALQALFASPGDNLFNSLEKHLIEHAYRHCGSNQVRAASLLGISRNVLRTLLRKHGLLGSTSEPSSDDTAEATLVERMDGEWSQPAPQY